MKPKTISLTKPQLESLIDSILDRRSKQKKRQHHDEEDRRLRNTQILMREFPKLKAHLDSDPKSYIDPDTYEMIAGTTVSEHQLAKYQYKTTELMKYVNQALADYKHVCEGGDESEVRRWSILYDSYLAEKRLTATQIAKKLGVDRTTISRERQKAIQAVSVHLFGIYGLGDFIDHWID